MKSMRIKVAWAAALMGVSALDIRNGLETGHYTFGEARKVCQGPVRWGRGQRNFKYLIFAPKFAAYLGISVEELWKEIEA